jgi:hypothetical protein
MTRRTLCIAATLRALATLFVICLAHSIPAGAQSHDRRLSWEQMQPLFPADARIQSAARIGRRTLAVWGAATGDDKAIRTVLWMQMLVDDVPTGDPTRLTSSEAMPANYVQVVASAGRFVVAWNDRRSGGLYPYMCTIDTLGVASPETALCGEGPIVRPGIFVNPTAQGMVVLWTDSANARSVLIQPLDSSGAAGPCRLLGRGTLYGIRPLGGASRLVMLDRGAEPLMFLDGNGEVASVHIPSADLRGPYHLAANGSIVVMHGEDIAIYASPLDSLPLRTVHPPLPANAIRPTLLCSLDSAGLLRCTYNALGPGTLTFGTTTGMLFMLLRETAPGVFAEPTERSRFNTYEGHHCESLTASLISVAVQRVCGNRYALYHKIHINSIWDCTSIPGSDASFNVQFNMLVDGEQAGYLYGSDTSCAETPDVRVERIHNAHASIVDVSTAAGHVRLEVPLDMGYLNTPQLSPALIAENGLVRIAWLSRGERSSAFLTPWSALNGAGGVVAELPFEYVVPNQALTGESRPILAMASHGFLVKTARFWKAAVDSIHSVDSQEHRFFVPSPDGWREVLQIGATGRVPVPRIAPPGFVADREEKLIGYGWDGDNGQIASFGVAAVDFGGARMWRADTIMQAMTDPYVIPVANDEYLAIDATSMRRFRRDSLVAQKTLSAMPGAACTPLLGSRFLRWSRSGDSVLMTLYDSAGTPLRGPRTVVITADSVPPSVVQNPADSGLVFVYGGGRGAMMAAVDKDLNVLWSRSYLSETREAVGHAVGVFSGDTLFGAWEDYRDGAASIYGRVIVLHTRAAVDAELDGGVGLADGVAAVAPNPLRGRAIVSLRRPARKAGLLRVIDLYGTVMAEHHVEPGMSAVDLDLSGLPSGLYVVCLSGGGARDRMKIVVSR